MRFKLLDWFLKKYIFIILVTILFETAQFLPV